MSTWTWIFAAIVVVVLVIIYLRRESFSTPDVIPGPVVSTYRAWGKRLSETPGTWPGPPEIIVGLHYTNWCPACRQVKPIWAQLKQELEGQRIRFVEIDEQATPTEGVDELPTIFKFQGGVGQRFRGMRTASGLREWILATGDYMTADSRRITRFPLKR